MDSSQAAIFFHALLLACNLSVRHDLGLKHVGQQKFTKSAYSRRPEASHQAGAHAQFAHQYGQPAAQLRPNMEKEPDAVSSLSDDQREEINEAVSLV